MHQNQACQPCSLWPPEAPASAASQMVIYFARSYYETPRFLWFRWPACGSGSPIQDGPSYSHQHWRQLEGNCTLVSQQYLSPARPPWFPSVWSWDSVCLPIHPLINWLTWHPTEGFYRLPSADWWSNWAYQCHCGATSARILQLSTRQLIRTRIYGRILLQQYLVCHS